MASKRARKTSSRIRWRSTSANSSSPHPRRRNASSRRWPRLCGDRRSVMKKNNDNYTATISVKQSPDEVFAAVNNVRGWWSQEIDGRTDALGEVFKFHYKDLHRTTHKITEFVPGKKVVWHITESQINFV